MTSVRLDKWLWAARFFKTRALASTACDLGRITANGLRAKASRDVRLGDMLQIKNEAAAFEIEVLQLADMRGSATVAQALYRETDLSRQARQKLEAERKQMLAFGAVAETKPSKRDRQQLSRLRGRTLQGESAPGYCQRVSIPAWPPFCRSTR